MLNSQILPPRRQRFDLNLSLIQNHTSMGLIADANNLEGHRHSENSFLSNIRPPYQMTCAKLYFHCADVLTICYLRQSIEKMQISGVGILKISQPYQKIRAKTNFHCADALPDC